MTVSLKHRYINQNFHHNYCPKNIPFWTLSEASDGYVLTTALYVRQPLPTIPFDYIIC